MSDLNTRCLDAFPEWLRTLSSDATELGALLEGGLADAAKKHTAGALNYLFKSLDLIPDGIEDLGFLDDAFVLRVAAQHAQKAAGGDAPAILARLAGEAALVSELLGKDYARLERYVDGLKDGAARGRTAEEIVGDDDVRASFLADLAAWSKSYSAPAFTRDEKNLVKLTSFLSAKLPS